MISAKSLEKLRKQAHRLGKRIATECDLPQYTVRRVLRGEVKNEDTNELVITTTVRILKESKEKAKRLEKQI